MTKSILLFWIFVVGGILLQVFLSKQRNKWWGFILPVIAVIVSAGITRLYFEVVPVTLDVDMGKRELVISSVILFFQLNILTLFLMGIYGVCRWKFVNKSEV